jgi:hypothetical protein
MTKRIALLFAVVSMAVASAGNSFRVNLYQPTMVNGTAFKPGEAKLELKDDKAVIKQGKTSVEASVKVEENKGKYILTTVGYKEGANHEIKDICVAGTTTHILFQ